MLFNSIEFIFIFLPICLVVYFFFNKLKLTTLSKAWLVLASIVFYSWWNVKYLLLILCSIIFNYSIGLQLGKDKLSRNKYINRKALLIFSITCNLLLLGYYKYTNFFISGVNHFTNLNLNLTHIILPLGISFFTFTQIAYLVDAYKKEVMEVDALNYILFVTFFPHLIAGPILHHSEMMPQFDDIKNKVFNYKNIAEGLFLFAIGLFKKVLIADNLAGFVAGGFDVAHHLSCSLAWFVSLAYTFQLYFDFSGYTDMALGIALMFNINLPKNFNSPYKAVNIQDFWRRWHMTLSRFLRDYIYIPLGGNKKGDFITCQNLVLTFLIGGLWHGASLTFVLWGFLHGIATVVHRLWQKINIKIPSLLAWFITFMFVNITWVFFRAKTWKDVYKVLGAMFNLDEFKFPRTYGLMFSFKDSTIEISWIILLACIFMLFFIKNSNEQLEIFKPNNRLAWLIGVIFIIALMNMNKVSEFLYFNF